MELRREEAAEKSLKAEIRCLKKRKKEEKRKTATLEEVCDEILEEGKPKWKKRRKLYDKEREEFEKKEQLRIEREERLRRASEKREELLKKLGRSKKVEFIKEGKSIEWVKRRKKMWREYRIKEGISIDDEKMLMRKLVESIPERSEKFSPENPQKSPFLAEKCQNSPDFSVKPERGINEGDKKRHNFKFKRT